MLGIGGQQQGQTQNEMNLNYNEFLREFLYPMEQSNWLLGMLSGTPYSTTKTTEQPVGSPNALGGLIGAGAAVAGMGGPNGFNWWGAGS